MRTIFTLLFAIISFVSLAQKTQHVDAETFKKLIDSNAGILVDLRTDDEIERKGMIDGAKQIDFLAKDSEKEILKLDKKKTYLIYCAGGGRSGQCAELMEKNGFTNVVNLEKGYDDWKRKGFTTISKDPEKK